MKPATPKTELPPSIQLRKAVFGGAPQLNIVLLTLLVGTGALLPRAATATLLTVINTNDSGGGSLRQAVSDAVSGDTINFASNVTNVINFTSSSVTITQNLALLGPGARTLAVSGGISNIFNVSAGIVLIADLTLSGGFNVSGGGVQLTGGALTISNCIVSGNTAPPGTGGVGGGISATGGSLTVINSTFNGNRAHLGGGIYNSGAQVALSNTTFTANEVTAGPDSAGAGIYNNSTLTIQSCTLASNLVTSGSGFGGGIRNFGTAHLRNSIVAGNSAPTGPDLEGAFISDGYNLIGANGASTGFTNGVNNDLVGTNARLGALQDNGGPTPTMALLAGSPAIDKGLGDGLTTDQRGQPRPFDNLMIPNASGGDGADMGAYESTFIVVNTHDSGAGSLRQAIQDNNVLGGSNTIVFANNVTGTIPLSSGELLVTRNVTIIGPGDKVLTVSGNNASRVFHLTNNAIANISDLTLADGFDVRGGAILQDSGTLSLNLCTISNNVSSAQGGGIAASGILTLTNCTLARNRGANDGGAIFQTNGSLSVARCTLSHNTNSIRGGAITVNPDATAVFNNSTFCSNSATFGGALMLYSTVRITNCTFTGNNAVFGGAINNFATAFTTVRNTILAGNKASADGWDCSGAFISGGFNLIGATNNSSGWTGPADQVGSTTAPINPLFAPLQDNGGPTLTMALLANSPAIDKGSRSGSTTDQRGQLRPFDFSSVANAAGGDSADIGAFEVVPIPQLKIQLTGNNVVLSWPATAMDFRLQSVTNLTSSNNWTAVSGTPIIVGTESILINNAPTESQCYRLIYP